MWPHLLVILTKAYEVGSIMLIMPICQMKIWGSKEVKGMEPGLLSTTLVIFPSCLHIGSRMISQIWQFFLLTI